MEFEESEVWSAVEALNQCWTKGRAAELREYFHDGMVAITPSERMPLLGRDACVSGWAEYAKSTKIISWKTLNPSIRIYGVTAVVIYQFEMQCEREGKTFRPSGRNMMVLIREAGR